MVVVVVLTGVVVVVVVVVVSTGVVVVVGSVVGRPALAHEDEAVHAVDLDRRGHVEARAALVHHGTDPGDHRGVEGGLAVPGDRALVPLATGRVQRPAGVTPGPRRIRRAETQAGARHPL